jgi:HD-like signal output (HDOD) protein
VLLNLPTGVIIEAAVGALQRTIATPTAFCIRKTEECANVGWLFLNRTMPHTADIPDRKRIFFVDDAPGLRKIFHTLLERLQPKWEIKEFEDAASTLAACEQAVPHLIISDQTMPKTTGTEMFDIIRQKYPETIRILISGHAVTANKIASAHQFLAKPFNIREIADTIQRAISAQESLSNPAVAKLVGSITSFPALPKSCLDILQELEGDVNTEKVSRLIGEDGGVLTRALHLANSPLFNGGTVVEDAGAALTQLGTRNMRALILSVHVFQGYEKLNLPEINYTRLWNHCCQTAGIAQQLAKKQSGAGDLQDVLFAGLVHDLGRLIMMENHREEYAGACLQAIAEKSSLEAVEMQRFGMNNTELTGFLLRLWGMPESVCRAVTNHLEPWLYPGETMVTASTVLYVANYLARQENPPDSFTTPPLNEEYLKAVGFQGIP